MSSGNETCTNVMVTFQVPDALTEGDVIFAFCRDKLEEMYGDDVYGGGQLERAPTTGKLHLQLFARMSKVTRMNTIRARFAGCHVERMKGTLQQAEDYCTKVGEGGLVYLEGAPACRWLMNEHLKGAGRGEIKWEDIFHLGHDGSTSVSDLRFCFDCGSYQCYC
jgi:hypothetical protein